MQLGDGLLRFNGLNNILKQSEDYKSIFSAIKCKKSPCQVHGLSESQKAYVSYCLFEDLGGQIILITHNDMEAKKLYDDIKVFTNDCMYFPIKEMVFNVDVTSGDIKTDRLRVIKKVLDGKKIIVITSIDAIFYRMPPQEVLRKAPLFLKCGEDIDILLLTSQLIDLGYERVDLVEGRGQFAQRGGIVDIFSTIDDEPVRVEFFGDEIDTAKASVQWAIPKQVLNGWINEAVDYMKKKYGNGEN